MLPLAPGRFSTTTGTLHRALNLSPSVRARMSMPVPGENGTTIVTGRLGYVVCAAGETTYPSRPLTIVDRKSTRLNSSHVRISYAVFFLKKKNKQEQQTCRCRAEPSCA